jgi:large conductance mechanosensitive channel
MSNKPAVQTPAVAAGFMKFLSKTNAIALAIGVIIGAAASSVVNSIVADLINPIIGLLLGGIPLAQAKIVLGTVTDAKGVVTENAIRYGNFISVLIQFVIIMLVVYIIAKVFAKDMLEDK